MLYYDYKTSPARLDSVRGSSIDIGTIQRRLARPLRKYDTHTSRSVNNFRSVAGPAAPDARRVDEVGHSTRAESPCFIIRIARVIGSVFVVSMSVIMCVSGALKSSSQSSCALGFGQMNGGHSVPVCHSG